ncbi:pentatricopeptide repeat-containing protein At2g13420, mitochondrial-like [Chenopodium quinoa]|uniref:Pentatricopeptide repeat-containing protein n=1 Tax=Chenopodium quinoa TaxID=63459 RepID=A0A803KNA2_CHEQI|nr:pentatricopeptide repeat-containing protein At2g13420, mitochondrial-like [Chenopodium quinoa]XP_021772569.1 pentatricopeptide repeat-containing protein At2g13420, mitochondrial-like [Chenopodium quinoa]
MAAQLTSRLLLQTHHHRHLPSISRFLCSVSPNPSSSSSSTAKPSIPSLQPSHDADLISNILIEHHNPFHAMESSLQLYGISLSSSLLHQTLIRLSHLSKIALSFFSYSLSSHPSAIDVTSFNIIVDILGKVRQFDVVWQLILQMQTLNLKPQNSTFLIFIRRLIAANFTRQAIRGFDDMPCFTETEVCKDDFVYVIDTLCKYGYVRVAMELFNKRKFGFEVCVKVYAVLIDGWCKVKRVDIGERLLREMIDKGIEPNVVCYNILLNGICRKSSLHPDDRFERTIRAADKVFDEMRERGIEPDVTSYSIVLHVCSRAHKPDLTLDRLEGMKAKGICPSVTTYTSVVKCLSSCGRVDDAERLLNEMIESGVTPSAVTYNCFFKELRGRKDAEKALELYRRMKKEGVCVASLHTYNILVQMFVKLNNMEVVEEIWNDMKEAGAGPDLDSYTVLIHGLVEKEKWREACEYFVQMIEKGFLPQKITFEMLYRGLIQADKLRTWRRLKKKLDEESISFGSEFEDYHLQPYKR